MKISARNRNILLASALFLIILGTLFIYNWKQYQVTLKEFESCDDDWCLRITGNVNYEIFIGITYLLNDSFDRVEDVEFQFLNNFGTKHNETFSGVKLWDILNLANLLTDESTCIRFESSDGFRSPELPLRIIKNHPDWVLVSTHVDGILLGYKNQGGDGPLMASVNMPSIENDSEMEQIFEEHNLDFVHNSKFNVKYLDTIIVI